MLFLPRSRIRLIYLKGLLGTEFPKHLCLKIPAYWEGRGGDGGGCRASHVMKHISRKRKLHVFFNHNAKLSPKTEFLYYFYFFSHI